MTVYTPKSLAERWECSQQTVRNMIDAGTLPAFKLGDKLWRIRGDVVEAYECQSGESLSCEAGSPSHGTTQPGNEGATVSTLTTTPKQRAAPLLSMRERQDLLARR